MSINSTIKYLYSIESRGMKFGLENTFELLKYFKNPQNNFRSIHIAGTNGKGSTTALIASVLMEAGFNVGIYSSPHLVRFNERIKINGKEISNKNLSKLTNKLKSKINKSDYTFFEVTTAICFKYFSDKKIDFAVIETGLGGRLDATNIVNPIVSVITKIDKDHTEILGNNLKQIAFEKGGIIKNKIPVVVSRNSKVILDELSKIAKNKNSKLILSDNIETKNYKSKLIGKHQTENLKTALATINILRQNNLAEISDSEIKLGIENVLINTHLHARYEQISNSPKIFCDVAHNPNAIKNLVIQIKKESKSKIKIIFGVMKDKNFKPMLKDLLKISNEIYFVHPNIDRALNYFDLPFGFQNNKKIINPNKPIDIFGAELLEKLSPTDFLLVTGSHYVVGEFLKIFKKT